MIRRHELGTRGIDFSNYSPPLCRRHGTGPVLFYEVSLNDLAPPRAAVCSDVPGDSVVLVASARAPVSRDHVVRGADKRRGPTLPRA